MKLQWKITMRWRGNVHHEAVTPSGSYLIKQFVGSNHFPTRFYPAGANASIDIGFDEPWNLRQAKQQCAAHVRLGSPAVADYAAIMQECGK